MACLRILFTRLRTEEKLLKEAADRLGIPCVMQNVTDTVFGEGDLFCGTDDVVLARCVSHNQNEGVAKLLEMQGVTVVNSSRVMEVCGNKLTTSVVLAEAGIPQPRFLTAFSQEGALSAVETLGYPAVCKPVSGSWGRLLAKINDRESAEAVFEHKSMLGAIHNTFYIQEYVNKGSFDVRAFVIAGKPVCAIARSSEHWITNTARGGHASNLPIDDEMHALLTAVHKAIGGEFLAVDVFRSKDRWVINEVNDGGEFRNSIEPTGTDIPGLVVKTAWERRNG
ncbi:MAG: lysine biosynthesis protein LysX [Synergistes sp.]|nr:lysine biosynthesis protein LysX [Synergistes sp.]